MHPLNTFPSIFLIVEGILTDFKDEQFSNVLKHKVVTPSGNSMYSIDLNSSANVIREFGNAVKQQRTIIPVLLDDSPYAKSIRLDKADIDQIEY